MTFPRLMPWLRFFRVVNLPTVPGDVLAGAAVAGAALPQDAVGRPETLVLVAAFNALAAYLFGLADNDIVGAATDSGRPIPEGEISLAAARFARALCLVAFGAVGWLAALPPAWWTMALVLVLAIVAYNRTKQSWLMGLCRGLNLLCGSAVLLPTLQAVRSRPTALVPALGAALVWTLYIGGLTKYSEGEELDPARRRRVGWLIGLLVYLQLVVLIAAYLVSDGSGCAFLLVGAVMLALLRIFKWAMPKVSAS